MILFINACVRAESRTKRLADFVLSKLDGEVKEVRLWEMDMPKADEAFINKRLELYKQNDYSSPIFDPARDFAAAETIVIAAPYWDLSFPSFLKTYLEQICVTGLTFFYNEKDLPQGLCNAKQLYYVTTAGGPIVNDAYGYGYVRELAKTFFEIPETYYIKAEMLDIVGYDAEAILAETISKIQENGFTLQ
ncbi:MAG: NAD(P)H-dependent oxidoreductase [Anaerolineaceae bacterium]|nr:NAD(P)H-dependent oxidoreductase [Anaerolineaceae bacterium]